MKEVGITSQYKEMCRYLDHRGEVYMADIIDEILYRIKKDHKLFSASMIHYMDD